MDASLEKIAHANRHFINRGSIAKACEQAEDYLTYINDNDLDAVKLEMEEFVGYVKQMRREARGEKEKKDK